MVLKNKAKTLICVSLVIMLVLSTVFIITSCKDKKSSITTDTLATNSPTTNAPTSTAQTTSAVIDVPVRSEGTKIEGTLLSSGYSEKGKYSSISAVVANEDLFVYAADETRNTVYLEGNVNGNVKYSSDRQINGLYYYLGKVYSIEGAEKGRIVELETKFGSDGRAESLSAVYGIPVGHTPEDMVRIGNKAYVANRFSGTVSVIDLQAKTVIKEIAINGREPNCLAVTGSKLYVGCHLTENTSKDRISSSNICVIDTNTDTITKTIELVNGASSVKDMCVSVSGDRIYVSHIIGRYTYPTTQLDRGWINTNGFSIIDTAKDEVYATLLIDEVDEGAANPWGITETSDGKYLAVAASGTNEVVLVDIAEMNKRLSAVGKANGLVSSLDKVVDFIPFLSDATERIKVGVGVRDIYSCKDNYSGKDMIYCGLYYDGAIDVIDVATKEVKRLTQFSQPQADKVRQGEILWADANNCYQKWQSCNSCHPDGIVDGFNWDNLNDGLGNAKSAKSMLYSHRTPPVMVTGIRANAEIAVGAGMKFIQFNTLSQDELSCIDEYLKTLLPTVSPYLTDEMTLTESAEAGKAIFEKSCASCHPAPLYTDMKLHNVNCATPNDPSEFDTPSLVEVWRTAPYMHDGSFATIEDVVRHFAPSLTDTEVKQTADFVRSICAVNEDFGLEQLNMTKDGTTLYNVYTPGAAVTSFTFRMQNQIDKPVKVSLEYYDKDGKLVSYCDIMPTELLYNVKYEVKLKDSITITDSGRIEVRFEYSDGEKAATPIIFK